MFKPKHDYETVLSDLRKQVLEVPSVIIKWAYDFRDANMKVQPNHLPLKISAKRGLLFPLSDSGIPHQTHIEYIVTVNTFWVDRPHDDEWCETLTLEVCNEFATGYGTIALPWKRKDYGKKKK